MNKHQRHIQTSILDAAKFFTSNPHLRTTHAFVRDEDGMPCHVKHGDPVTFCPIGRIAYEAEIDSGALTLKALAKLGLDPIDICMINDESGEPHATPRIVKHLKIMARKIK